MSHTYYLDIPGYELSVAICNSDFSGPITINAWRQDPKGPMDPPQLTVLIPDGILLPLLQRVLEVKAETFAVDHFPRLVQSLLRS